MDKDIYISDNFEIVHWYCLVLNLINQIKMVLTPLCNGHWFVIVTMKNFSLKCPFRNNLSSFMMKVY